MFFDAILNSVMDLIFFGTRQQVRQWLWDNTTMRNAPGVMILAGDTQGLFTVYEYLDEEKESSRKTIRRVRVIITIHSMEVVYSQSTSVMVDRGRTLRIYQGMQQIAFYLDGDWKSYTVEAT